MIIFGILIIKFNSLLIYFYIIITYLPWCALAMGKGSPIFQKRYKYKNRPAVDIISVFLLLKPFKLVSINFDK